MSITKTNFINFSRCPRYFALENIKNDKLSKIDNYDEYQKEEQQSNIEELLDFMFDENDDNLIDKVDHQLEAMLPYYNQVEFEAAKVAKNYFTGTFKYAHNTKNQKSFSFNNNNNVNYLCYVDIYNESNNDINIIEVKATTTNKYLNLQTGYRKSKKYSIFKKINNILYLKDELKDYNITKEMPLDSYNKYRNKLFDRYDIGQYVFDLAVQRFIIENEYKEKNKKIPKINYYLAVLNDKYVFDGTYVNNKPIYNKNNDEELITFINLTKVTEEYQNIVITENNNLLDYIEKVDSSPCNLGNYCSYKKRNECKFFKKICSQKIPEHNSSLNYIRGITIEENGNKISGLDLINAGYFSMLDIDESKIKNPNHLIQRNCLKNNTIYINKAKIKKGLEQIEYPIYHLDFETMPCPLPRFKGEKPYTQSPFEFSLHIESSPGNCDFDRDWHIFLADSQNDCREELIKEMLKYIDPNKGTLLAQNVSFEKGRIKELAESFPKYKDDLLKIYNRGFDLIWLINNKEELYERLGFSNEDSKTMNYYNNLLNGSFSIKKTLPIFSNLSYKNLIVKNGTEAIVEYANYNNMTLEEFKIKYQALKDYCKQDTWAMVVILDALRNIVK